MADGEVYVVAMALLTVEPRQVGKAIQGGGGSKYDGKVLFFFGSWSVGLS